jgi:hypothetical protein
VMSDDCENVCIYYEDAFVGGLLLNVLILKRNCPQ